jgi:hypothetical protein
MAGGGSRWRLPSLPAIHPKESILPPCPPSDIRHASCPAKEWYYLGSQLGSRHLLGQRLWRYRGTDIPPGEAQRLGGQGLALCLFLGGGARGQSSGRRAGALTATTTEAQDTAKALDIILDIWIGRRTMQYTNTVCDLQAGGAQGCQHLPPPKAC